ncbi:MAG: zf-HC2 domain-containing protein [Chloroflexota bacterium]|nr:zf-HC2 domain-containing protein [Chloroflexota bacterium]
MAHETLACAEGIAPERLSALRDETLPTAEATRLRAHVAACDACRARLADYDTLTAALRQERELEPDERIVDGVRARLAEEAQPRARLRPPTRSSRRVWAGLAALAPVAAIILLFVYVFSGLAGRSKPAAASTPSVVAPTPVPTNQYGKPVYATATSALVSVPPMTPSVSASAAWGAFSPVATYQTPDVANTAFSFDALSSDATTLVGTEMTNADPGSGQQNVYLVAYNLASHAYWRLGPHWTGYGGPWGGVIAVNADYIDYGFNSQPGATCGVCNSTLWTYDRQTGATWEFDPGKQYGGVLGVMASGDYVAYTPMEQQVWVADPSTHQVTLALPIGAQPIDPLKNTTAPQVSVRLDGFVWPNLIYEYTPSQTDPNTPVNTSLRITNLQTKVTTTIPTPLSSLLGAQNSDATIDWAYISGDTLYFTTFTELNGVGAAGAPVNTNYGTLFRMSLANLTGQPTLLARWDQAQYGQSTPNSDIAPRSANDRLIVLGSGYVWDIAEGRLVRLPSVSGAETPVASLAGSYLLLTHTVSARDPQAPVLAATIYDTSRFATR